MFTRDTLKKLHSLTDSVNEAKEIASEQLRTAQDRYGDRTQKLNREGKDIELKESVLWEEVFLMGLGCQAGKILQRLHPDVFKSYAEQDKAADELKKFCILELGVDHTKMTLSGYLKITEKLFEIMINEKLSKITCDTSKPKDKNWLSRIIKK